VRAGYCSRKREDVVKWAKHDIYGCFQSAIPSSLMPKNTFRLCSSEEGTSHLTPASIECSDGRMGILILAANQLM
jgi:hypothetical protein